MTEHLAITTDGPVRILTMTGQPRRGNPLSDRMAKDLVAALVEAEQDDSIHAVVLAGTPTHFSVGADLTEVHHKTAIEAVLADWLEEFDRFAHARKPTIAAVRGHAVGGGFELALSCDLMVCAEDANLALPETGIGVIAGQGGTQRILHLAGRAIAADLILTGRALTGAEAGAHGIAARVVPADQVLGKAIELGKKIAERSPPAIRFAREVLREAAEDPIRQSLKLERLLASLILDTPERKERVGAFLNRKSKPA
ncbi:enoyl-CoA hydratase/isomerase family protein [Geminicoccus roseus]|uniref:enoyl-CoA hydratase/isomerase family protein n=1 Tax=Geminicoccus roseus TaxID=404900 RepID=UPI00041175C5|nr:enoyl-CoA hydratase/isomerase family protein [Geminicoccus roseus]